MSDQVDGPAPVPRPLPESPNLDWLRKQAKRRLDELRKSNPSAKLADSQFGLAKRYGFPSWRALKAHVDALAVDGQLFDAAKKGDVDSLASLLDRHPDKLHVRDKPYEWSLLHAAARAGHLAAVDLLLRRGLDVNTREKGDNTCAMHWAAAGGHLDVVRRLADAGGDVVGRGDDHGLEVIGWASCWETMPLHTRRAVADFLVSRGARHQIYSALALQDAGEVRRIVAADPASLHQRMSHNENFQQPLHYAVGHNLPEMVELLLELGADPLGRDGTDCPPAMYATSPDIDRRVMEAIARAGKMNLLTAVALGDWPSAERLWRDDGQVIEPRVLHLMCKRGNAAAVKWLLGHGADPNARWAHWDAEVTPLHLAAWGGSVEVVRLLLAAGADPTVRDSKHDGDAIGWATHFRRPEIVQILKEHTAGS